MRTFILGTDWWTDCDDVVAVRILSRAVKSGQIHLAGIAINACMEVSAPSLDGFLRQEGLSGIPIGLDQTAVNFGGTPSYQHGIVQRCNTGFHNEDAEDALRLYRKILSQAQTPVEIIEIGFLQVIATLLESQPDDISDKTGLELVQEKVSHFWVMAGKWDQNGEKEHNFCLNPRTRTAARIFCEKCPVPVTFLGFEVGVDVISGSHLNADDPLYQVMCDHGSFHGRSSWDPMLVQLALTGDPQAAGYDFVQGTASVEEETGCNFFAESPHGLHRYVVRKYSADHYAAQIDSIIASQSPDPILCPSCHTPCQPEDRFCSSCGSSLSGQSSKSRHSPLPAVIVMVAMILIGFVVYFATRSHSSVSLEYPWFRMENGTLYFLEDDYSGNSDLVIPVSIDGQTVTALGRNCFANSTLLTSVLLPNTLTEIQSGAFRSCSSLRGVFIPGDSVSLGDDVFQDCQKLEAICFASIPASIGENCFDSCHSVRYIFFPGASEEWFDLYDVFINPYAYVICSDGVFPQGGQIPRS